MNFKIKITSKSLQNSITFDLDDCIITVQQKSDSKDYSSRILKVKCITRPDLFLESRCCINDSITGNDLTFNHVLETNPIKDPNHWLTRPDEEVGKYFKPIKDKDINWKKNYHKRRLKKHE